MAEEILPPAGRVVRDPAFSAEVRGRANREGELEVVAVKKGDWETSPTTIKPSVAKAQQIQGALKDTLRAQLEAEATNLGGDADLMAIHGKTGVTCC